MCNQKIEMIKELLLKRMHIGPGFYLAHTLIVIGLVVSCEDV